MDTQVKVLHELTRVIEGEPRIRDLDLAVGLGYTDLYQIRGLIESLRADLLKFGGLFVAATKSGGRPGRETWLNEDQAYLVCSAGKTPKAAAFRVLLIKVFKLYRQGLLAPKQESLVTTILHEQTQLLQSQLFEAAMRVVEPTIQRAVEPVLQAVETQKAETAAGFAQVHVGMAGIARTVEETKLVSLATLADVVEVKKTQGYRRVDVTAATLELHIICLHQGRHGICPRCEEKAILDERGVKIAGFTIDHWFKRNRNKPEETWPVCDKCNGRMEDDLPYRQAGEPHFRTYQGLLAKLIAKLDGRQISMWGVA